MLRTEFIDIIEAENKAYKELCEREARAIEYSDRCKRIHERRDFFDFIFCMSVIFIPIIVLFICELF